MTFHVRFPLLGVILLALSSPLQAKLTPEQLQQLPVPAAAKVDFARDIQPIFEASCLQCHGRGKAKGAFSIETRADFMLGGDTGVPAVAGKSAESLVVEMVSGLAPDVIMPKKGKTLTRDQVATFRAWIDQGLPWPEEITFLKQEPANLRPRDIAAPAARPGLENPIDRFVDAYFAKNNLAWGQPVDDRTLARRVWLDTVGLLPSPEELEAFVADRATDKRPVLVQHLLANHQSYAEHWLTFWNDLLRNDYKGTGYIDGGRKQITAWLYTALARNLPYDQFVAQLIHPGAESEGFTKGILWRGAVNASMVPPMQAAQGIAQVFLGVNLKCASCHDSFINAYTLEDAYGIASIYANGPLEIAECDKPTGHMARVKFLYSELGGIDAEAGPEQRKQQLAEIITGRKNGRLPRTIVNRLWQRFMGYGLVEPVDEMDHPAWSPELLDWLAEDLVAHGYDLKHTMTRILTSRAYQLRPVNVGETEEHFVFRGPGVRRLTAEQFADAVMTLVGTPYGKADTRFNRQIALGDNTREKLPLEPQWIWSTPKAAEKARPASVVFKRDVVLEALPVVATLAIAADDNFTVKINGKTAGSSGRRNSTLTEYYDLKSFLQVGPNRFEITAVNLPIDDGKTPPAEFGSEYDNPAGLLVYARIRTASTVHDVVSDRSWNYVMSKPRADPMPASAAAVSAAAGAVTATTGTAAKPVAAATESTAPKGEARARGAAKSAASEAGAESPAEILAPAVELGGLEQAPWRIGRYFLDVAAAGPDTLPVQRAALVAADPLTAALGRPNREQIVTVRQGTATTLQALELTNGSTLATILKQGAAKRLAEAPGTAEALINGLYLQTLCRPPTPRETQVATRMLEAHPGAEGVEDIVWAITMLPEFQLIY